MRNRSPARRRFCALLRLDDAAINLAEAALCIAWEDQGRDDPRAALRELDTLAREASGRLAGEETPARRVAALNHYLFEELGFRGNTWSYSDPANSFLDQVLATRAGLPITLSIVYLEVGRRLGLPLEGLALPGHFLVRYAGPEGDIYIDPFGRGRIWSRADCERQVVAAYGASGPALLARVMQPPSAREILARILRNLKNAYIEAQAFDLAYAAAERILMITPRDPQEIRDRGLIRAHLGQLHLALDDLDRYAADATDAADLAALRRQARGLAEAIVKGN